MFFCFCLVAFVAATEKDHTAYVTSPITRALQLQNRRATTSVSIQIPRNALGFLCQDNPLVEEMGTKCKTLSRNIGRLGCDRKIVDLAVEQRRSFDSIPAAYRLARVADACPESCGLCGICAPGCATWFIRNGYCEEACNNANCQFDGGDCWDVDCVVGEWSAWSDCSILCDPNDQNGIGGVETRTRAVAIPKMLDGKPCPNLQETRTGCNKGISCPKACELGSWGEWGECSVTCGLGQMDRKREILRPATHGAPECSSTIQSRSCQQPECPRECELGEWSPWSTCEGSCGLGTQSRVRSVQIAPTGDLRCGPTFEEQSCFSSKCSEILGNTCQLSSFGNWSTCSEECGVGGLQTRSRSYLVDDRDLVLNPLQLSCPSSNQLVEEQPCNIFPCQNDCIYTEWTEWSTCDAICGLGVSRRTRAVVEGSRCGGVLSQEKACFVHNCARDCVLGEWTPWSSCETVASCGYGISTRSREVVVFPSDSSASCAPLSESQSCDVPCEIDCQLGNSNSWTDCSSECQINRSLTDEIFSYLWTPIALISSSCPQPESLVEKRSCGSKGTVCVDSSPNDCVVSEWGAWSDCSVTCGGGLRSRERTRIQENLPGGKACPTLIEAEECGTADCPVNCDMSEWSEWTECNSSCGLGTQSRRRAILAEATLQGLPCGPTVQVSPCVGSLGGCSEDCIVSDWTDWTECSATCGSEGLRTRSRNILSMPFGNGLECPDLNEWDDCNRIPCSDECMYSDWSSWSSCNLECGSSGGFEVRVRSLIRGSLDKCPEPLMENRECSSLPLCAVDCIVSTWSSWSPCDNPCGIGTQFRERTIVVNSIGSGLPCGPLIEVVECFVESCEFECKVDEWSEWTPCNKECGGGVTTRRREILQHPSANSAPCPETFDYDDCNVDVCPEELGVNPNDCVLSEWNSWAPCPVECGGGVQSRTRTIVADAKPGGAPCGELEQIRGCGISRCRDKPCEDNVKVLAENGVTCTILRAVGCEMNIKDVGTAQGIPYPKEMPPEARVKDACPVTCDVCKECSPGCQIRDIGNTICDESCNNEACDFDLGDCGSACKLPLPIPAGLELKPPATGLDLEQIVTVKCSSPNERFSLHPELSYAVLKCSEAPNGIDAELIVLPKEVFAPKYQSVFSDFSSLSCSSDECPWIGVTGFPQGSMHFNGVYERGVSPDGHLQFIQNERSPELKLENGSSMSPHHLWTDVDDAYLKTLLSSLGIAQNYGNFIFYISPERVSDIDGLQSLVAAPSTCKLTAIGSYIDFTKCGKTIWGRTLINNPNEVVESYNNVTIGCIDRDTRREMLKSPGNGDALGLYEDGKPITYLYSDGVLEKMFCEDQPDVERISGTSCSQIIGAVGCNFLLKDTGRALPTFLPVTTTVGMICPESCELCEEHCGVGCPTWFVGNGMCDIACNNADCQYDGGDCAVSDVLGRPFTYLITENRMVYCEDQPEVLILAGMSCPDIVGAVGCNFKLSQTGRAIPDYLPADTTVAVVCPHTCDLCDTECSPGCLEWFRGNLNCDQACNNALCNFDNGDCSHLPEGVGSDSFQSQNVKGTISSGDSSLVTSTTTTLCQDNSTVSNLIGLSCSILKTSGRQGCYTLIEDILRSRNSQALLPDTIHKDTTVADICPVTCDSCYRASPSPSTVAAISEGTYEDCVDDPMVVTMGFTCPLLMAVANNRLNGCQAKLVDIAEAQGEQLHLPADVPPITRLIDACPVTCQCCDCWRLKKPKPRPANWTPPPVVSTLEIGEFANCINDPQVQEVSGMDCYQLVESVGGNCTILLQDLSSSYPDSLSPDLTVANSCGVACGKCPVCEDSTVVESTAGYSCPQIVQMLDGKCDYFLSDLGQMPEGIPLMAQLKHACPLSCGYCNAGLEYNREQCIDDPRLDELEISCSILYRVTLGRCDYFLSDIGVTALPPDVAANARVSDLCPLTCGTCSSGHRCSDNSMVANMGQNCATIIQAVALGCQSFLNELGADTLPLVAPASFRIRDICPESCGLCLEQTSCADGYQNGLETGIDCGGPCRPCRECGPSIIKSLGPEYVVTGLGTSHMSSKSIRCSSGYEFVTGVEPDEMVCLDGIYKRRYGLVCGVPKVGLLKGVMRLLKGDVLDHNATPMIFDALVATLNLPQPLDVRISSIGNCAEMSEDIDFICEDNPEVKTVGVDCSLLARLGCHLVLSDLARQQGTVMSSGIPADATVADACPITCNSCDYAKKRMRELLLSQQSSNSQVSFDHDCLVVDYYIFGGVGVESYKVDTGRINSQFHHNLFIHLKHGAYVFENRKIEENIDPIIVVSEETEIKLLPKTSWDEAYDNTNGVAILDVYSYPGVPFPSFEQMNAGSNVVGKRYQPLGQSNELLTKFDSAGDSTVISGIVLKSKNKCINLPEADYPNDCCNVKQDVLQLTGGRCGKLIFGKVLSHDDMMKFCFERSTTMMQAPRLEGFNNVLISCYEKANRIIDKYRNRKGAACELLHYVNQFVSTLCSKEGIKDILQTSSSERYDSSTPFCLLSLKMTRQLRFELNYISLLPESEMLGLSMPHSCIRQHLRYFDALTQLQFGWSFAVAPGLDQMHSTQKNSSGRLLRSEEEILTERSVATSLTPSHVRFEKPKVPMLYYNEAPQSLRFLQQQEDYVATRIVGSFIGETTEEFLSVITNKADERFCQETFILLNDEMLFNNPTSIKTSCSGACFSSMTSGLGGLLETFGQRTGDPMFEALGVILRSYGRFYCEENAQKMKCGEYIFKKLQGSRFNVTEDIKFSTRFPDLSECKCPRSYIGDGECDLQCYSEACSYDGNDCRVAVMFPEIYYALLEVYTDADPTSSLSIDTRAPCLVYDLNFTCDAKCRRLHEAGSNIQGCCVPAGIEALGSLLQVDSKHPLAPNIYDTSRAHDFIEHFCAATLDRTCSGGEYRNIVRLDIGMTGVDIDSHEGDTFHDHGNNTKSTLLGGHTRKFFARKLLLVDADISRFIIRHLKKRILVELYVDAGDHNTQRVVKLLSDSETVNDIVQFFIRSLENPSFNSIYNNPVVSFEGFTLRSTYTFPSDFSRAASSPLAGSINPVRGLSVEYESCTTESLWELGDGYRVGRADSVSTLHGSTRSVSCSFGYENVLDKSLSSGFLLCSHGRWIPSINCEKLCDLNVASALQLNETSYVILPGGNAYQKLVSCTSNHMTARGRNNTVTNCSHGLWSPISLECKRYCEAFTPDDADAYVVVSYPNNDHGTRLVLSCASSYYPNPAINGEIVTQCDDGVWGELPIQCIKPSEVNPNAGPGMFKMILNRLFTGPGLIGIISGLCIALVVIVSVTLLWIFKFREKADTHTTDYERKLDSVARLAGMPETTHQLTTASIVGDHDEDYFGDVELTPPSSSNNNRIRFSEFPHAAESTFSEDTKGKSIIITQLACDSSP